MQPANSISLAVSTGLVSHNLKPGEIAEGEFDVINPGDVNTRFKIEVAPLSFENDDYELVFNDPNAFNQITDWIELKTASGSLAPNEKKTIKYRIRVPKDVPAGGQYASFLVSLDNGAESEASGVSVSNKARIAVLLYSKVAGETREEGTVVENNVSAFYFDQPIKTSSIVKNTGNVHIPATYTLRVFPLFGNEELFSNDESPDTSTVIPGTTLYQEKVWQESPVLGVFRIQQDIDFGDHIDRRETIALVAPSWFLVLALTFLGAVIFAFANRIKNSRKPLDKKKHKCIIGDTKGHKNKN